MSDGPYKVKMPTTRSNTWAVTGPFCFEVFSSQQAAIANRDLRNEVYSRALSAKDAEVTVYRVALKEIENYEPDHAMRLDWNIGVVQDIAREALAKGASS